MELNNKECKDFVSQYKDEELELVVLFNDETCGSGRVNGDLFWTASAEFLAYQKQLLVKLKTEMAALSG